ncbi:hypothetical protein HRbin03_00001 [archaeon HR03]|nr:hypothetical protein HRbin03_00001 [archaeon HR03]
MFSGLRVDYLEKEVVRPEVEALFILAFYSCSRAQCLGGPVDVSAAAAFLSQL